MCGRYTLATPAEELVEAFDVPVPTFDIPPRYNVAPGQEAIVVGEDRRGRRMGRLYWGFVPAGGDPSASGWINARGETADRAPSFREAFAHRRCLVPADGFYEWRREGEGKVPFWFHAADGGVLAFAAIWEHWAPPGRAPRDGFAILTVPANGDVADVHHRMPLIVAPGDRSAWLSRSATPAALKDLVHPAPDGSLEGHAVSSRVNATRNEGPDLIRRA